MNFQAKNRMMMMMIMIITTTLNQAFDGDGTFYGAGGNGANGACMLPPDFNGVDTTVAMNHVQFDNGAACGRCVRITGNGGGAGMTPILGPLYGTVDNECPECKHGDIDLGLAGDGRWNINWEYISCNEIPHRSLRGNRFSFMEKKLNLAWWKWW